MAESGGFPHRGATGPGSGVPRCLFLEDFVRAVSYDSLRAAGVANASVPVATVSLQ